MSAQSNKLSFSLDKNFVAQYKDVKPGFGFNGLGEFTYRRTYSRVKADGTNEEWWETVERVVNGTYSIQKDHVLNNSLPWKEKKAQESAQEMYDRIFKMKFLPPGRGLWVMGTPVVHERGLGAALQNCAFRSTRNIHKDFAAPFCFMMDASMLGVGVGFDVDGAGKITITKPSDLGYVYAVPDSREGWIESVRLLLVSYLGNADIEFDYSQIRPVGTPIKTFGGVSQGSKPLELLHTQIRAELDTLEGKPITATAITNIMNMIGCCVVAGNVRRSAQIALGPDTEEYMDLKNYDKNPERAAYGWTSNNTVKVNVGANYNAIANRIVLNGEPGLYWSDNVQKFGRMGEMKKDPAIGVNPCAEQPLQDGEFCTLVETFPHRHDSYEDYERSLKFAYLYGKTVTLVKTQWPYSNQVMMKNRRIGTSQSGVVQAIAKHGLDTLKNWSRNGYDYIQQLDKKYSDWLGVPMSIRTTTIKPSGTVSLLAGATPGIHFPESRFYIRRVRVSKDSLLVKEMKEAGYHVEDDKVSANTSVISFPIGITEDIRCAKDVSVWEQLSLAAFMQEHWSDNAVSVTITFNPEEANQIPHAIEIFQYKLKTLSFLPRQQKIVYAQMPYEAITEKEYESMMKDLRDIKFKTKTDGIGEKFCDGDYCVI